MRRSQSTPGLGKGCNPLQGYLVDSRTMLVMSPEELEAERLYYGVISTAICKAAFMVLAKDLARRSPDAGAYLTWLIQRGRCWPSVTATV